MYAHSVQLQVILHVDYSDYIVTYDTTIKLHPLDTRTKSKVQCDFQNESRDPVPLISR